MSTFYLLPPRPLLGERFAGFLTSLLPGLDWSSATWPDLADVLGVTAGAHTDVYVVYREELPEGENVGRALVDGFGAEAGDRVIEVRTGPRPGEMISQSWRVGEGPEGVNVQQVVEKKSRLTPGGQPASQESSTVSD